MSKVRPFGFSRSHTRQQLPNIQTKIQRSGTLRQQKSYVGQITKQLSGNTEYDEINNVNLNREQRKLKDILRKMNDDTVKIIANYTPKRNKVQHHRTATTILAINQKQMENNHKIIVQCQAELNKLKERFQGLNMEDKSSYVEYIANISSQIANMQEQNRILNLQNQKRGKDIISEHRIIQEGLLRKIQNDVYLAEHKASHLRVDDRRVREQIKLYEQKLIQINEKWVQAEKFLKQQEKKTKQKNQLKNNESEYLNRRTILLNGRKKNEFYNQNFQYRYYHLLKQLDDTNVTVIQIQQKLQKTSVQLSASKMILSKLQTQLNTIKQKNKLRQESINQFLENARQNSVKNRFSKEEQKLLISSAKQMPSEIQIKQDGEESSSVQFDSAMKEMQEGRDKNGEIIRQISKQMKKQNLQRRDVLLNQG